MKLISPAFVHNKMIPVEYTCQGANVSPGINISEIPKNAKSLVLIMDDPDAPMGTWDHWVAFNIPPTTNEIKTGEEPKGIAGKNSWGKPGYGGPCPPSGTHRYFFKIYALDRTLILSEGASKSQIESAMHGHILEKAELVGLYRKS